MRTDTTLEGAHTITTTSLGPVEVRIEALRLALVQSPGEATCSLRVALERARSFETYINTGKV